jgi:hypothetical protein
MEVEGVEGGTAGEPVFGPLGIENSKRGGTADGCCSCTGVEIVALLCAGMRGEGPAVDGWGVDPWPFGMRGIGVGRGGGKAEVVFDGATEGS